MGIVMCLFPMASGINAPMLFLNKWEGREYVDFQLDKFRRTVNWPKTDGKGEKNLWVKLFYWCNLGHLILLVLRFLYF
jgi:hypothetical protein